MPSIEDDNRRLFILKQQLRVIVLFETDLGLAKREQQEAIDNILDEMIEIFNRLKTQSNPNKND